MKYNTKIGLIMLLVGIIALSLGFGYSILAEDIMAMFPLLHPAIIFMTAITLFFGGIIFLIGSLEILLAKRSEEE